MAQHARRPSFTKPSVLTRLRRQGRAAQGRLPRVPLPPRGTARR